MREKKNWKENHRDGNWEMVAKKEGRELGKGE